MLDILINYFFNPVNEFLSFLMTNSEVMKISNLIIMVGLYGLIHIKNKYSRSDDMYCFKMIYNIMILVCYFNTLTLLLPITEFKLENMNYVLIFIGILSFVDKIKEIKDDTVEHKNKYRLPKRTKLGFYNFRDYK